MLRYETITDETLTLLRSIQSLPELKAARLAGGTALALQLGHRQSVDIDIFGKTLPGSDVLLELYRRIGKVEPISLAEKINICWIDGIKVDTVNYPYPWIDAPVCEDSLRLASVKDIAAMKIAAIVNRGTKKDFIDIFYLLELFSLPDILSLYTGKYNDASLFMAVKSLTYYDDAETDPMPLMFRNISWENVKRRVSDCVREMMG